MSFTLTLVTSVKAVDSAIVNNIEDMQEYLVSLRQHEFGELWIYAPSGQVLAVLTHNTRAFVMYLREEGDPGLYAREPDYQGTSNDSIEFRSGNGQQDVHPFNKTVSLDAALAAVEYFIGYNGTDPRLIWQDEH